MALPMHGNDYILESARLGFRLMQEADFEDLRALDMDPEVRAHFPGGISTVQQVAERIARNRDLFAQKGYCDFVLIEKGSGNFAGRAGFGELPDGEVEVGYLFLKRLWGRGLAQEALRALLAWAAESVDLQRILAYAPVAHSASLNVMRKCGMRFLKNDKAHGVDCVFYEHPLRC